MQIGHQRVHFGFALHGILCTGDVFVGVRDAEGAQNLHFLGGFLAVELVFHEERVGRHFRLRHDVARVVQVRTLPVIGVTTANTGQIWPGTFGTPQERVIPDAFTGDRVVPIAFGFGTERTDHLRVAADTAVGDVNVAAFQFQRRTRLHAFDRLVGNVLEKQRNDLGQAANTDGDDHEEGQQANILLDSFMLHQ